MTVVTDQVEPRRRLHPLTPWLRGGRLVLVVVAAISWGGYQDLGTARWLLSIGSVAVLLIIGSLLSYLVTGYHVVGRELRIYEGLFVRRTRAIPVDRLQSVELVRSLVARLLGLAELRLEVVGGHRTEAPLSFMTLAEATALRARLLAARATATAIPAQRTPLTGTAGDSLAQTAAVDANDVDAVAFADGAPSRAAASSADAVALADAVVSPEQLVHTVSNKDLVISQLLRPRWWLLPLAVVTPIVVLLQDKDLRFIAVASTVTAVFGAVLAPLRLLSGDWRFTITTADDGLHIRRGLTETHVNTVPQGRIQSMAVEWPLLWRIPGWVRASMHIAGVRDRRQGPQHAGLLPVGTVEAAQTVLASALPGFVLGDVLVHPTPRRAVVLAPLRRLVLGYQLGPAAFVCRDGLITRQLVIVPYGRIQSVRVHQGPVQRLLRLASVHVDVAGGGGHRGAALHRDVREARALAIALAEHSRAARQSLHTPA